MGAPLKFGGAMDRKLEKHSVDLQRAGVRLNDIQRRDALILLRHSLKFMHNLCTSACSQHHLLLKLDKTLRLRDCPCNLLNADLSEYQWLHATPPVQVLKFAVFCSLPICLSGFL